MSEYVVHLAPPAEERRLHVHASSLKEALGHSVVNGLIVQGWVITRAEAVGAPDGPLSDIPKLSTGSDQHFSKAEIRRGTWHRGR